MINMLFGRRSPPPSRRSMENPSTPLSDPDPWLVDAWGGGLTSSGIAVNHETALTYSPVWRATNLISRDVAKLPFFVYRRSGSGKERDTSHAAYTLLRHKRYPSVFLQRITMKTTTAFTVFHCHVWEHMFLHLMLSG